MGLRRILSLSLAVGLWVGVLAPLRALARGDIVPGSRFTSGRGAALGDAVLPLGDDGAHALFYNPAGIARIRAPHAEPMNFQFQANTDAVDVAGVDLYKFPLLKSYLGTLTANPRKFPGMGVGVLPNFYTRYFAIGTLLQSHMAATVDGDYVRYRSKYQFIPAVSTGFRLASGVVRVGYTFQYVSEASGDITTEKESSDLSFSEGLAQGAAMSHNVGVALTLPFTYLPALNVVARNISGAKFDRPALLRIAKNSSGTPSDEPMTIDASLSISPKLGLGTVVNLVAAYRDALNTSGVSIFGRAAVAMEIAFREQYYLRLGWGSGYPAYGVGLRRKNSDLSLSIFSEEVGRRYHDERDIRYMLHYQVRAF